MLIAVLFTDGLVQSGERDMDEGIADRPPRTGSSVQGAAAATTVSHAAIAGTHAVWRTSIHIPRFSISEPTAVGFLDRRFLE
nr:hypothetical protein [Streptomyces sp.]